MSSYFQSLTSHLHDKDLMSDDLKAALHEHDNAINSRELQEAHMRALRASEPSIKIPFGKYKDKKISEIAQFDQKYLQWAIKQSWMFDDLKTEIQKVLQ